MPEPQATTQAPPDPKTITPEPVKPQQIPGTHIPAARMTVEDDPNHKMALMIAKRGKKAEGTEGDKAKEGEKTGETPTKPGGAQDSKPASGVVGLIAEALKMRPEKPKESDKKAGDQAKTEVKEPEKKAEPAKTIITKKKAEPKPADPMRLAAEAAGAAVREAISGTFPKGQPKETTPTVPEDELPEDFRREYEVAKYLGEVNPKYKGAEKAVLNEFARTEQYARQWEAENKGKAFDPKSEDHDEFYSTLTTPWDEHEFRQAEIRMEAEKIADEKIKGQTAKFREIEQNNARMELAQVVNTAIQTSGAALAKAVDEGAHGVMVKDGFSKLEEADPITSEELVRTLNVLAPMIETAILVDDPKQRLDFDAQKNPEHKQWLNFLFEKEEQYRGTEDDKGRLFASRNEFVKLSPAQQKGRWYLDVNHIIAEMIGDAATAAKQNIEKERGRQKKIAISLGYVPKETKPSDAEKKEDPSGATKTAEIKKAETSNGAPEKPLSPTAGGGPKIDDKGEKPKTRFDGVFGEMTKTLFGR